MRYGVLRFVDVLRTDLLCPTGCYNDIISWKKERNPTRRRQFRKSLIVLIKKFKVKLFKNSLVTIICHFLQNREDTRLKKVLFN